MAVTGIGMLITLLLLSMPANGSELDVHSRLYTNRSLRAEFCTNISLEGSLLHIARFKHWLNEIAKIPHGRVTLAAIINSGHTLVIAHSKSARISAGRTQAPMSENLINGKGESVRILFDATISERGSHLVYNSKRELIEFTAVENLFHELAHARYKMNGTWRHFDSEGQAIEEENIFRRELALESDGIVTERVWTTGVPIESVANMPDSAPRKLLIRSNPVMFYEEGYPSNVSKNLEVIQ